MTTEFWWVRHGPTHAKTLIGHTDIAADLSDHKALNRLATFLPKTDAVFSSDLIRASETARAIAKYPSPAQRLKTLREMNFGDWEGLDFTTVAKSDPDLSRKFWENPGDASPPNGESWDVFSRRIHNQINRFTSQNIGQKVVVVAHFGVILAALQLAGNFSAKSVFSFKIANLSVTKLNYDPVSSGWAIQIVNQNV
ncbi:MAG: histidine phosphatase family protein [Rhodobacteraceae bacterium]|nr:histidine phosphatase family protein [Paracoccaceae bacterium]